MLSFLRSWLKAGASFNNNQWKNSILYFWREPLLKGRNLNHHGVAPAPAQRWLLETQTQIWCPQRRNTGSSSWQQVASILPRRSGDDKLLWFFAVADLCKGGLGMMFFFGTWIFLPNFEFISIFSFSIILTWNPSTRVAPQSRAVSHPRLSANRNHRFAWWQSWQTGKDSFFESL